MDKVTPQQFFTETLNYLRSQKFPSVVGDRCVFRSRNGNKCAIGYWIPDDKYKHEYDGPTFGLKDILAELPHLSEVPYNLAGDMQSLHDRRSASNGLHRPLDEVGAADIAELHGLIYHAIE